MEMKFLANIFPHAYHALGIHCSIYFMCISFKEFSQRSLFYKETEAEGHSEMAKVNSKLRESEF